MSVSSTSRASGNSNKKFEELNQDAEKASKAHHEKKAQAADTGSAACGGVAAGGSIVEQCGQGTIVGAIGSGIKAGGQIGQTVSSSVASAERGKADEAAAKAVEGTGRVAESGRKLNEQVKAYKEAKNKNGQNSNGAQASLTAQEKVTTPPASSGGSSFSPSAPASTT